MGKEGNQNYRVKAQEVEPIKNMKDINRVKQFFLSKEEVRNYTIFVLGINVGLRAGDLLSLKMGDVFEKIDDNIYCLVDEVNILEGKTNKTRTFTLNESAKEAIAFYVENLNPDYIYTTGNSNTTKKKKTNVDETRFKDIPINDYLFKSRKGSNSKLRVDSLHKIVKSTMRDLGIKGNYGTHTLRKTFGYFAFTNNVKDNPRILQELQKIFNHSSEFITLSYIGITKESITNIYNSVNL
ncbi:MAG TPA: tyrosine-type recombinase/integrase [Clostridiales bacterium]|nr:tyrosine-type recombinase/integrase [Clostridiales bacterium]